MVTLGAFSLHQQRFRVAGGQCGAYQGADAGVAILHASYPTVHGIPNVLDTRVTGTWDTTEERQVTSREDASCHRHLVSRSFRIEVDMVLSGKSGTYSPDTLVSDAFHTFVWAFSCISPSSSFAAAFMTLCFVSGHRTGLVCDEERDIAL